MITWEKITIRDMAVDSMKQCCLCAAKNEWEKSNLYYGRATAYKTVMGMLYGVDMEENFFYKSWLCEYDKIMRERAEASVI